ncbi:twin-arginine translocase TatA/TatE family subunit [Curtobacterium flaccumfaciens]|uniref:Sec-independent protein translocase protein TatA n=2 Tax=Microbacteriaceae TaxID=85023 RepID=A0A9Q9PC26_9MICO|nr:MULTISPECIES: twin-arginine translocase TatA/TatE family subunit [Curtobacterium]MBO9038834.1 twin-arginine translocase TatA/TatE family subunit [Curtobacterium flaccumfaciens pv. flaccumfaciens]MCS6562707.1 twin-arginine translocase TatA/TatE family subunit [Curtobacterium flaccumfaciens pv. poinsettiae]MDT0234156.1 twin-arginine translocase TatA/TatE family subunit [Curtobacterium sp. BRB10]UXN27064.1 twin-arginine translocase TatA/TatE family subunit [Curtobacterium flaccumfaciens]UXN296
MLGNLTGLHLLIILGIVILLFGATKLPALAKGLGQSINIFKKEMSDDEKKAKGADGTVQNTTAGPAAPVQPVVNPEPSVQPNADSRHYSQN